MLILALIIVAWLVVSYVIGIILYNGLIEKIPLFDGPYQFKNDSPLENHRNYCQNRCMLSYRCRKMSYVPLALGQYECGVYRQAWDKQLRIAQDNYNEGGRYNLSMTCEEIWEAE